MSIARCALGAALAALTAAAQASVVNFDITGTYDTAGASVFGQSGSAVAYHYTFSYDTALNTNGFHFAPGDAIGADTAGTGFYGYSKSGIVASSFTFGTQSWTATDLAERVLAVGIGADLWFDTDISVLAPGMALLFFSNAGGALALGTAAAGGGSLGLYGGSFVSEHTNRVAEARGSMNISATDAGNEVPEPSTWALAAFGLLAAAGLSNRPRSADAPMCAST